MIYFAETTFAFYRRFWFSCAAITAASFILLFGSTAFFEGSSPVVFDSEHEMQESDPKAEYLYQNPLLIFRLYSTIYHQIRDADNDFRTNPVFIGSALLSLALPVAFIFSSYHFTKPIKQNG